MSSRYMDNYDSDPNMQGDGPPMLVLGRVRKAGGATNRIIFDSTDHPDHARAAELADLEREIGRAVIAEALLYEAAQDLPCLERDALSLLQNLQMAALSETDPLIAQWRKLHAEGAEAEAATERQEEK